MLALSEIRDYIESFGIAETVYSGKMDNKPKHCIGVYNREARYPPRECIGTESSYQIKPISILIHWDKKQRDTEEKAWELYLALKGKENFEIGSTKIQFIQMLQNEPVDVATDEEGIYEFVIELDFYYKAERKDKL
ncbi:MAG: minor capsid protein [Lachnospiraceae bacterium]|nr:minor capsid protein [Lachnospiraceae bacterium]